MKNFVKYILILFLSITILEASNNIRLKVVEGKKNEYSIGDKIKIKIAAKMPKETCLEGMQQSRIYLKGLKKISEKEWVEIKSRIWVKELELKIVSTKSEYGELTILRKADKGDFFYQHRFKLKK